MKRARGQAALFPIVTRPIPPWRLFDGDTALRDKKVREVRRQISVHWAVFCSDIDGFPHWPGGSE